MDKKECITWLKILRANMKTFPEISANKKIEALTMAIRIIEQEPKAGHWIDCDNVEDYSADGYDCSVCGVNAEYATSYCPNCGARMVEPQESEVGE